MATLCKCVTVAQEMVWQDRKLHCLRHEFLLSTPTTYWFWSRVIGLAMSNLQLSCVCCVLVRRGNLEVAQILICWLLPTRHFHVLNRSFSNKFSMCWVLDTFQQLGGEGAPPWTPSPFPLDPLPPSSQAKPLVGSRRKHTSYMIPAPCFVGFGCVDLVQK